MRVQIWQTCAFRMNEIERVTVRKISILRCAIPLSNHIYKFLRWRQLLRRSYFEIVSKGTRLKNHVLTVIETSKSVTVQLFDLANCAYFQLSPRISFLKVRMVSDFDFLFLLFCVTGTVIVIDSMVKNAPFWIIHIIAQVCIEWEVWQN